MAVVARTPEVKLGQTVSNGIAPSMFALLERGVTRRPDLAAELRGKVAIRFTDDIAPVRIVFGSRVVRVEDGDLRSADLAVTGTLPHIVQLTITPMIRMGIPDFRDSRGRAALLRVAFGRVRLSGDIALARKLLEMLSVPAPEGPHRRARRPRPRVAERTEVVWIDVLT
jgi:hypothetical protein